MRRVTEMTADVVYRGPGRDDVVSGTLHMKDGETVYVTGRDGVTVTFVYEDGCLVRADVYDMKQRGRRAIRETRRQFAEWSRRPPWDRTAE